MTVDRRLMPPFWRSNPAQPHGSRYPAMRPEMTSASRGRCQPTKIGPLTLIGSKGGRWAVGLRAQRIGVLRLGRRGFFVLVDDADGRSRLRDIRLGGRCFTWRR